MERLRVTASLQYRTFPAPDRPAGARRFLATIFAVAMTVMAAAAPLNASASPLDRPLGQGASDRLVLAFYYAWFDNNTWSPDRLSDLPAQTYASSDRAAMARHIEQAKAAGIDAFLVAWYGPNGNQTESNLAALLDEAAARDFRVGVLFETDSPFLNGIGDVTSAMQHLNAVHANHPAYLRAAGRPVVFFWRPSVYSVDAWRGVRDQADPSRANIWISEGADISYLQVFDGHHLYSNTWNPPADLAATNATFAGRVASTSQNLATPKLWVATVMPGYDDTRIRPQGFARDRAGGSYYSAAWQSAIDSAPAWIVINSFNEWPEGTYIEPSLAYGDYYIGLTAQWSSAFKGSPAPIVQAASLPAPEPEFAQPPHVAQPTAFVDTALLNLRAGPGTGYEIVGQAVSGEPLPITGSSPDHPEWWRVGVDSGTAWVYAPLVATAGPVDSVDVVASDQIPVLRVESEHAAGPRSALPLHDPLFRPLTPYLSP